MKIAVLSETRGAERRVAVVPSTVAAMVRRGPEVCVQSGAGVGAFFSDENYAAAGASIGADAAQTAGGADIVVRIGPPDTNELDILSSGQVLVCVLAPGGNEELIKRLADLGVSAFALDTVPRITRAQAMDVLSSQSTVAGYRAVLLAVGSLGVMAPMMMTAAGTIRPANALVIGAGVAGLQAIATAKRLGAVVTVIDVRPVAREQVESLGAKFIPMEVDHGAENSGGYAADLGADFYRAEQEIIAPFAKKADFIITTAMIPGRPAPLLITEQMVVDMKPGAVIVDLAAPTGGNCELSDPGQTVGRGGVTIYAPLNLPSDIPIDASSMFSSNVAAFIGELLDDNNQLNIDLENEIIKGTLKTHEGKIL